MAWLQFLLSGPLLILCWSSPEDSARSINCTSCDEFVGKICKKNLGSCQSRHPDFACQTKEIYTQRYTGEFFYLYSMLGCPKRCVEYIRISNSEKNVFHCCNESYCNSLSVKDQTPYEPTLFERLY
ncbi:prostate and testis expressed protein 2-like [Erinaceus europaeus]|uniref:Prostate and testis expressed protein 2-like n=1 Tax=Erinaceus europaeus TaxID=9365 RepID=A0A1S3WTR5_ERIEU|nr:prostate and testis expressed protein 2-like [Erinaceus europaeus]